MGNAQYFVQTNTVFLMKKHDPFCKKTVPPDQKHDFLLKEQQQILL